jgi:hypothetical protein
MEPKAIFYVLLRMEEYCWSVEEFFVLVPIRSFRSLWLECLADCALCLCVGVCSCLDSPSRFLADRLLFSFVEE